MCDNSTQGCGENGNRMLEYFQTIHYGIILFEDKF